MHIFSKIQIIIFFLLLSLLIENEKVGGRHHSTLEESSIRSPKEKEEEAGQNCHNSWRRRPLFFVGLHARELFQKKKKQHHSLMMMVLFCQLRENPTVSPKLQPESRYYHSFGPPICHCPPPLLFFLVNNDKAANVSAHKHGGFPKLQKLAVLNVAPFPNPRGIGLEVPAPLLTMMGKSARVE
mmetsp:Transcript_28856/g.50050  ORF Transcript_28856/g.50050 Transcript_28856/m.50050 type:complete len:183 (+) Transcript_28856:91-639(+)